MIFCHLLQIVSYEFKYGVKLLFGYFMLLTQY